MGYDLTTKKNYKDKYKYNHKLREHIQIVVEETCDFRDIWSEWWGDMTWPTKRQLLKQWKGQSQKEVDRPWHRHDMVCKLEWIVYISDSWEPEFRTIVTWQLRVTLDSIRNSCNVWPIPMKFLKDTGILDRNVVEDGGCDHLELFWCRNVSACSVFIFVWNCH